jgi:hypothetical protein
MTTVLHKAGDRWTENVAKEWVNPIETENLRTFYLTHGAHVF